LSVNPQDSFLILIFSFKCFKSSLSLSSFSCKHSFLSLFLLIHLIVTKVNCIMILSLFSSPVNSGGELLLFLFTFLWFYSAWLNQIQSRFAHSPGLLDYLTYEIFYPIGWLITGLEVRTLERVFLSHPYSIFALFTAFEYKEENLVLGLVGLLTQSPLTGLADYAGYTGLAGLSAEEPSFLFPVGIHSSLLAGELTSTVQGGDLYIILYLFDLALII